MKKFIEFMSIEVVLVLVVFIMVVCILTTSKTSEITVEKYTWINDNIQFIPKEVMRDAMEDYKISRWEYKDIRSVVESRHRDIRIKELLDSMVGTEND